MDHGWETALDMGKKAVKKIPTHNNVVPKLVRNCTYTIYCHFKLDRRMPDDLTILFNYQKHRDLQTVERFFRLLFVRRVVVVVVVVFPFHWCDRAHTADISCKGGRHPVHPDRDRYNSALGGMFHRYRIICATIYWLSVCPSVSVFLAYDTFSLVSHLEYLVDVVDCWVVLKLKKEAPSWGSFVVGVCFRPAFLGRNRVRLSR